MPNNSITKLPRSVLAKMTGGDNQAIKAFENMEVATTLTIPQQIALLNQLVEIANSNASQATVLAYEALQAIQPNLPAVAVPIDPDTYLQPVGVSLTTDNYLVNV